MKLYHATHTSNRDSILEKGLEPRISKKFDFGYKDKRVFLFGDMSDKTPLDFVGYEYIDIWEVEVDDSLTLKPDEIAGKDGYKNCFYTNQPISPERLRIVETIF